jgi:hypothetical protein
MNATLRDENVKMRAALTRIYKGGDNLSAAIAEGVIAPKVLGY